MTATDIKEDYPFLISLGSFAMAVRLSELERDSTRQHKKNRVVRKKRSLLSATFPQYSDEIQRGDFQGLFASTDWPKEAATTYLIDLAFTDPFAPYTLKYSDSDFEVALTDVARYVGEDHNTVNRIRDTRREALKAHFKVKWGKIALLGLGGLVVAGLGGWVFAPIIAGSLGAAAGLSGAAATAHGLALLGGGSLAMGGAGMAGGTWLVTGVGAALGGTALGGGRLLFELGAAHARVELIKLQISYKMSVLENQAQLAKSQAVITKLVEEKQNLAETLADERYLNEENAQRLKDLEATITAIENAITWMQKTGNAAIQVRS
jgi:hypothetical protein